MELEGVEDPVQDHDPSDTVETGESTIKVSSKEGPMLGFTSFQGKVDWQLAESSGTARRDVHGERKR
jgi:hypothetical protein